MDVQMMFPNAPNTLWGLVSKGIQKQLAEGIGAQGIAKTHEVNQVKSTYIPPKFNIS